MTLLTILKKDVAFIKLGVKKTLNQLNINFFNRLNYQDYSGDFTGYNSGLNVFLQTKKRFMLGGGINYNSIRKDFNEPRQGNTSGIYFSRPGNLSINSWFNTNSQKKFGLNMNVFHSMFFNNPKSYFSFNLSPRYRLNNQFSINYFFSYGKTSNDQGYVNKVGSEIIFGDRNRKNYKYRNMFCNK